MDRQVAYNQRRTISGEESVRPVIETTVYLLRQRWRIELTLAARAELGFRLLLGRQAIRGRFLYQGDALLHLATDTRSVEQ